nr:uncharacterized protein LOC101436786 isoform X1 [Dasypus novemcinctus]
MALSGPNISIISVSVSLSMSVSLSLFLSVYVYHSISLSLSLPFSISLCLCLFISLCLSYLSISSIPLSLYLLSLALSTSSSNLYLPFLLDFFRCISRALCPWGTKTACSKMQRCPVRSQPCPGRGAGLGLSGSVQRALPGVEARQPADRRVDTPVRTHSSARWTVRAPPPASRSFSEAMLPKQTLPEGDRAPLLLASRAPGLLVRSHLRMSLQFPEGVFQGSRHSTTLKNERKPHCLRQRWEEKSASGLVKLCAREKLPDPASLPRTGRTPARAVPGPSAPGHLQDQPCPGASRSLFLGFSAGRLLQAPLLALPLRALPVSGPALVGLRGAPPSRWCPFGPWSLSRQRPSVHPPLSFPGTR